MKKVLLLCLIAAQSFAFDSVSVGGGLLLNTPDLDGGSGVDEESAFSLQVGAIAKSEIADKIDFRTGAFLQRKNYTLETQSLELDLALDYLTIPLTVAYNLNDKFNLIGGLSASVLIADDCDVDNGTCQFDDTETFVPSLIVGGGMFFNDSLSGEAYIERTLSEVSESTEITSLVFNVLYNI